LSTLTVPSLAVAKNVLADSPLSAGTAAGREDVCHFLYGASAYGLIVGTVERRSSAGWCVIAARAESGTGQRSLPALATKDR
jgi:hypothetical protein